MTRQIFDNDMTAHVWAQQRQPSGRSNNGNLYFEGRTLYSYGTHYPVGIFVAPGGPVFLNSSKSSITTEGKHKGPARSAVRHIPVKYYLPELDELADMIARASQAPGNRLPASAPEHHKRNAESYLAKHWQAIDADNGGAAWILRAIGSRATWAAMRARYASKAEIKAATNKARATAHAIKAGREMASAAWPLIRATAWQSATDYRQSGLRSTIKDCRESRLATPKAHKRVRAALYRMETGLRAVLASAEADSDRHGNAGSRTKARAVLGRLRRFKAGAIGFVPGFGGTDGPDKREAALSLPSGAGWRMLADMIRDLSATGVHISPATRAAAEALRIKADAIATKCEGEEKQRRDIAEARRRVIEGLATFNRGRRNWTAHSAHVAAGRAAGEVTDYNADRALSRSLDSILSYIPSATPWGTERGFELCPALASRAARVAARAEALAAPLAIVRESLRSTIEREQEAARLADRAERERVARMSDAEKRDAWEAGELSDSHVAYLANGGAGPLLRAIAPEIDGCRVTGGTLATSQGATVPLRHAFRVFQLVALCRAEGKAWTPGATWGPRDIRVGHFRVDSIAPSGDFVAGCHAIKWGEVSRLAARLGVADCLAALPELMAEETDA